MNLTNLIINTNIKTDTTKWNDSNKIHELLDFCQKLIKESEKYNFFSSFFLEVREYVKVHYDISLDKNKYCNMYRFYDTAEKKLIPWCFTLFISEGESKFSHQVYEYKIKILKYQKRLKKV